MHHCGHFRHDFGWIAPKHHHLKRSFCHHQVLDWRIELHHQGTKRQHLDLHREQTIHHYQIHHHERLLSRRLRLEMIEKNSNIMSFGASG